MEQHRLRFKTAALAMVFFLGLMACSGAKINQENFDKIKPGMTLAEVKAILGEPADSSSIDMAVISGATAMWKGEGVTINIQFMNGKVVAKEFLKPGKEAPKLGQ
ncbi:MAG: outer membrane protein assembly factor BamE [Deltaproteobacteria bacterium]|nr:outer membrane protein assembly factor BamE [Deltaproteobacteria bacterium]